MTDPIMYGVWYYANGHRSWLLGVHSDIDTLRELSNKHQEVECRHQRGVRMIFADGEMTSSKFSYFNGESQYVARLEIEVLPTFPVPA